MLSPIYFNLDQSKILSPGNGLNSNADKLNHGLRMILFYTSIYT